MRPLPVLALGTAVSASLLVPASALADHVSVSMETGVGDCGPMMVSAQALPDGSPYQETARLVVLTADGVETIPLGEQLYVAREDMTVPPTGTRTGELRYRVWGGDEHFYANPPLLDLDSLLAHVDEGGSPLDAEAPGVAWAVSTAEACPDDVSEPTPAPAPEPDPEPGHTSPPKPDPDPTPEPEPESGPTPAPEPTPEPTTGPVPAAWLEGLPATPGGMRPGQWCAADDRLVTLYAYTGNSALQCQDVNGWRWIQVHSADDLIEAPAGESTTPSPEKSDPAPSEADEVPVPTSEGTLPTTGESLTGLVAMGAASVLTGAGALWATRRTRGMKAC